MFLQPCLRRSMLPLLALSFLATLFLGCSDPVEKQLAEVRSLQEAGQIPASIELLRSVLKDDPDHGAANFLLGASLYKSGQTSSSIWPLEKAFRDPETHLAAGALLAQIYLDTKNTAQAVRVATELIEENPELTGMVLLRATAAIEAGDHEAALTDARSVRSQEPENIRALLTEASALWKLGRLAEAEEPYAEAKEVALRLEQEEDAVLAWLELGRLRHDREVSEEDLEKGRAAEIFTEVLEAYPANPLVLRTAREYFEFTNQLPRIRETLKKAAEENPDRMDLQMSYAGFLSEIGDFKAALEVLEAADPAEENPNILMARAELLSGAEDFAGSAAIFRRIEEVSGSSDMLQMKLADLLISAGEIEEAKEAIGLVEDRAYRDLLNGRIALNAGDYKEAYALLSNAVKKWPNNGAARYSTALAALALGKRDVAASEFLEAVRNDPEGDTDAALGLAQLELERGDYSRAQEFANRYLLKAARKRGPDYIASGLRIQIAARLGLGQISHAENQLRLLENMEGRELAVAVDRAAILNKKSGPEAAATSLREADLDLADPANASALQSLVRNYVEAEKSGDAQAVVQELIAKSPNASLFVLLGQLQAERTDIAAAEQSYREALKLDPEEADALMHLAVLARNRGELEEALALLEQARAIAPSANQSFLSAGILDALGRQGEAIEALREAVRLTPTHVGALNNLAWLLAESGGDLDEALQMSRRAGRLAKTETVFDTLGFVFLKREDYLQAQQAFERALAKQDRPGYRYHLGLALEGLGQHEEALAAFEQALATEGEFAEAEQARVAIARVSATRAE